MISREFLKKKKKIIEIYAIDFISQYTGSLETNIDSL